MKRQALKLPPVKGEPLPVWSRRFLRSRACIVCASKKHTIICYRPDGLPVARCLNCSAMYLPFIPSKKDLDRFYRDYSETKGYLQVAHTSSYGTLFHDAKKQIQKLVSNIPTGKILLHWWKRRKPLAISLFPEILARTGDLRNKVFLEVGPGKWGGILPELKTYGAHVIAVEIDPAAKRELESQEIGVFSTINEIQGSVDGACLSMVLEHLEQPLDTLRQLSAKVTEGGRVLIAVPNAEQAKDVFDNWIGFRVDLEHLNYFTVQSLSMILAKTGFGVECLWKLSQPMLPEYRPYSDRDHLRKTLNDGLRLRASFGQFDPFGESGEFALVILARRVSSKSKWTTRQI